MVNTTIQISHDLRNELNKRKFSDNESYEEVIWDLLAEKEIKEGKTISHEQLKKELGL